jgi:putative acetyltransferase
MEIREGGLGDPQVEALLAFHRADAARLFPAENAHALPSDGLAKPGVTFFSAWDGPALLGVGALRALDDTHAEIKSMRTHPDQLRKGVARAMLDHLIAAARARGFQRLSLETGVMGDFFVPAVTLYQRAGFVDCAAFGDYPPSPYNRFMTLALS